MQGNTTTDATASGDTGRDRSTDHNSRQPMNLHNRSNGESRDERAVSEVIGAILMFGLVLAVLSLIQVSAVPAANQQIEYEHSQRIEGDFQQLDTAIDGAAFDGARSTTPLELGARYPVRLFLLNPGPVSGDIRTSASEVQLSGFNATNSETDDYLRESLPAFGTRHVAYHANYNEYASAPRVGYEGGVLYERYAANAGGRDVLVDRGALVSGRRITLVTLDGDLSTGQVDELSLDAVPVSSSRAPVSVEAPAGGATITVETSLSEATWKNEVLETEFDPNGDQPDRYVRAIECTVKDYDDETKPCDGTLEITFEQGTYNLRMAKVGLGSGFAEEGARYLTTVSGDESSITDLQTQRLTVEARDRYNNPVSGVEVSFSANDGGFQVTNNDGTTSVVSGPITATTDEDGQASVIFVPDGTDEYDIRAATDLNGDGDTTDDPEEVTFDVSVTNADGGGGNTGEGPEVINRGDRGLIYTYAEVDPEMGQNKLGKKAWAVKFNSSNGENYTFKQARISFVAAESGVSEATNVTWDGNPAGSNVSIVDPDGPIPVGGKFVDIDSGVQVGPNEERFVFKFDEKFLSGQSRQEFFVLSVLVEDASEEESYQTFFIGQTPDET